MGNSEVLLFDEVGIPYYCFAFFDGGRKLELPVTKLLVFVEIVRFSDIRSDAEEKRTGDDKKALVYADKPQTLDHLEDNIRRVIADIRPQMLEKVIENWTSRLDYIRASRGSPMPEIIFRM
ncbi:hypothetical protein TNCV_3136511 [Trichonephila clavipes]|nr:hypothetical protein TNCV_3136511 [Trichonephila clavipes]